MTHLKQNFAHHFLRLFAFLIFSLLLASSANAVLINEIRIDQPSSDNDEYIELVGSVNESLNSLSLIVIGDGTGGSGTIEEVISLSGQQIGTSGHFLIVEPTFSLATGADLTLSANGLNLENSDNLTVLLVSDFTGADGNDLDTDNDGILDVLPWTAIVDSIALVESPDLSASGSEHFYSENTVGPNGTFSPAHSIRCFDGFRIGSEFDPTNQDAQDTPGAVNDCELVINELRIDQSGNDDDEYIEIGAAGNASLQGLSVLAIGDDESNSSGVVESVVSLNAYTTNPNGLFTIAEATFTLNGVTADLTAALNFENSDNVTHLIVRDFTGANGDDLDSDDDGTLDSEPWSEVVSSVALVETVGSGEQVYGVESIGPNGTFVPAHVYRCPDGLRIGTFSTSDGDAKDTPTQANNCSVVVLPAVERTIPEIQGDGAASPFDGTRVRTTGVVTADFQGTDNLSGFFIQDRLGDGDGATSDGVFVFEGNSSLADVSVGDEVTVEASVTEFFDLTELNNITSITINSSANMVPEPTVITLPETVDGDLERFEGMLVSVGSPMTVVQTTLLSRSGRLVLASPDDEGNLGRLFQPTNLFAAGSVEVSELVDENRRRSLVLDDGKSGSPDPVSFLGALPADVVRAGDRVSNLVGVLDYGLTDGGVTASEFRLQPTQVPVFESINARTESPASVGGRLKIASFNVLNFFTTLNERGADSEAELTRQEDKLVSALVAMDADVVGLIEVENNGLGAGSAIRRLVDAVNLEIGSLEYELLPVGGLLTPIGTDQITVAFIYKPASVTPTGTAATLSTGAFDQTLTDGGRSRQPVAASFTEASTGEVFTAVINHFKSKRPPSETQNNGNDDQGDGQASWNLRRTEAANDLADWLATNPTGVDDPDVLILGDLNAYAKEDPILALNSKGYNDLVAQFESADRYSFIFDAQSGYLDHALGTQALTTQVSGVTTWHINADEPNVLDYNLESKPTDYYQANPFRSSDHDPVIVGLDLGEQSEQETCFVLKAVNDKVVVFCL